MSISQLATKTELKRGLMGYFDINEDIGDTYMIEVGNVNSDAEFPLKEMYKIDEECVDAMVEYIFKYHVNRV